MQNQVCCQLTSSSYNRINIEKYFNELISCYVIVENFKTYHTYTKLTLMTIDTITLSNYAKVRSLFIHKTLPCEFQMSKAKV